MENKRPQKDTGNELSPKWIYTIIIALVLGFGVYGYFTVKKWARHTAIERQEKPITDYTITKIYKDLKLQKKSHKKGAVQDVDKEDYEYFMEVSYKEKKHKLEINETTYNEYKDNTEDVVLYDDSKNDEIFIANTGASNLFTTALCLVVVLIIALILLIQLLIKSIKKKYSAKRL